MTDYISPSLTPSDLPISGTDDGVSGYIRWEWFRSNAVLSTHLVEGRWVTLMEGSVEVSADVGNSGPMTVRLVYPTVDADISNEDLGVVAAGTTEIFNFSVVIGGVTGLIQPDVDYPPDGKPMFELMFFFDTPGTDGFTIDDLDVVYTSTDVAPPTSLLLVQAASPSFTSTNVASLTVPDMLAQVLVDSLPLADWLGGAVDRAATIDLDGSPNVNINSTSGLNGISTLTLDSDSVPDTYTQPYRVHLYLIEEGGELSEPTQVEITEFDPASDTTGVVTFILQAGEVTPPSSNEGNPWWYCTPVDAPPAPPARPTSFVLFADYDADYKYPLASSRVPAPIKTGPFEEGCHGCAPEIISCED